MIGDPIEITGSPILTIPDGVRFSKALRDTYLYRAMLDFLEKLKASTVALPKDVRDEVWSTTLPTYLIAETIDASTVFNVGEPTAEQALTRKLVYMYALSSAEKTGARQLLFTEKSPAAFYRLQNLRHKVKVDPMFTVIGYDAGSTSVLRMCIDTSDYLFLFDTYLQGDIQALYVPIPYNPSVQDPEDLLDFEPYLYDKIIERANIYARIDSQDLMEPERLLNVTGGR